MSGVCETGVCWVSLRNMANLAATMFFNRLDFTGVNLLLVSGRVVVETT